MTIKFLIVSTLVGIVISCATCPGGNGGPNAPFEGSSGRGRGGELGNGLGGSFNNGAQGNGIRGGFGRGNGFGQGSNGGFPGSQGGRQGGNGGYPGSQGSGFGGNFGNGQWSGFGNPGNANLGLANNHMHLVCSPPQSFSPNTQQGTVNIRGKRDPASPAGYGSPYPGTFGGSTRGGSPGGLPGQADNRPLLLCRQEARAKRQVNFPMPGSPNLPESASGLPRFDHLHITCFSPEDVFGRSAGSTLSNNMGGSRGGFGGFGSGSRGTGFQTPSNGQLACFLDALANEYGEGPVSLGGRQGNQNFGGFGGGSFSNGNGFLGTNPTHGNNNADLHIMCYPEQEINPPTPEQPASPPHQHLMCFDEQQGIAPEGGMGGLLGGNQGGFPGSQGSNGGFPGFQGGSQGGQGGFSGYSG